VNLEPEVNMYVGEAEHRLKEEKSVLLATDLKGKTGVRPTNTTAAFYIPL
jgi:hypothetical protein